MNNVSDVNLRQDLSPLFVRTEFIENWLKTWRESYLHLLSHYKIHSVTELERIELDQDQRTGNYSFVYSYRTEDGSTVSISYALSDYWITFREGDLSIKPDKMIVEIIHFTRYGTSDPTDSDEKLTQYATLFAQKNESYLRKANGVILGDRIVTKLIRMSTDKLDQKEQIVLDMSTLLSCTLGDVLK